MEIGEPETAALAPYWKAVTAISRRRPLRLDAPGVL